MADAINAENYKKELAFLIKETFDLLCESGRENNAEVALVDEQVSVEISVIAREGSNAITRRTTTTTGTEKTTTITGQKITNDTEESFTQSTEAAAFTAVTTTTKADPEQTTTRRTPFKTSRTVQTGAPDIAVTEETQNATQNSVRQAGGGDQTDRFTEYNSL